MESSTYAQIEALSAAYFLQRGEEERIPSPCILLSALSYVADTMRPARELQGQAYDGMPLDDFLSIADELDAAKREFSENVEQIFRQTGLTRFEFYDILCYGAKTGKISEEFRYGGHPISKELLIFEAMRDHLISFGDKEFRPNLRIEEIEE
ncbi:hypothetical protein JW968_03800 [Candidatus Woesearchaeota archaeon]|nr:hypothetical protein [Candidatus Woesearchaeota archaeon]